MVQTTNVNDISGCLYSICLQDTETVETAHERDMATFREAIQEGGNAGNALNPNILCHDVLPHNGTLPQKLDLQASRQQRIAADSSGKTVQPQKISSFSAKSQKVAARKSTTAASFFANDNKTNNKKSTSSKKAAPSAVSSTTKTTKANAKGKEATAVVVPPSKKETVAGKKKKERPPIDIDDSDDDNDYTATVNMSQPEDSLEEEEEQSPCKKRNFDLADEKENHPNSNNKDKHVGNADDFMGDEDEDDDFVTAEQEREERNAKQRKTQEKEVAENTQKVKRAKQHGRKTIAIDKDDDDDNDHKEVVGAMDAFSKKETKLSGNRTKKRRKKLEEKTSMDASGYIHTETITVWEDVSSDEEKQQEIKKQTAKVVNPLAKTKVANTKHMKQAGLMGFFAKK